MKTKDLLILCIWILPLVSMDGHITYEFNQEHLERIIRKVGGKEVCDSILANWSLYEKRLLVTMFQLDKWPTHCKDEPIPFAKGKEVHNDHFEVMVHGKKIAVSMNDFRVLAQLHRVPVFANYNEEISKFDDLHQHFATEDEVWEQLDRQLTRAKSSS